MNLHRVIAIIKILRKGFGKYKTKIVIMILLGFFGGLLGGIGIGTIVPLFSFVIQEQNSSDNISRTIGYIFSILHLNYSLMALIIFAAILLIIKSVFMYIANYINARITANYEKESRNDLFVKTMNADWPFLLEQKIGHLETLLITDISRSSGVLDQLSGTILVTTSLIAYSVVALNISLIITLITLSLGVVLFFVLRPFFYKIRKLSQNWAKISKSVANQVGEYIIGAKTIKTSSIENNIQQKVKKDFNELRNARIKLTIYTNLQTLFQEPVSIILVLAIFAFSYTRASFQFSSFVAVIYLVQKMFSFMQSIQARLSSINETIPFLESVISYGEKTKDNREIKEKEPNKFKFGEILEIRDMEFAYNEHDKIISGLNLRINKGEAIGLIGPSGVGKTTIVDLLLKLFKPTAGGIFVDGISISDISTSEWRRNVGYVSQDIFLLSDTIENNIRFFNDSVTKNDIIEAAEMANISKAIQALPNKFESMVGERGVKLSVGQRQRIVLARILARKPKILILDEATSSLDNESEALIQKTLENLRGKITILIIAHRLTTVMKCDRIIALENGKIVEQGTPEELLENENSYFYKTYNMPGLDK